MAIIEVLRDKRPEILRIATQHGALNIRVFGSVARGEARPDSDIDFLVNVEAGRSLLDLEPSPRERKPGSGKGQLLYMAPDFDETPAGFEDYG